MIFVYLPEIFSAPPTNNSLHLTCGFCRSVCVKYTSNSLMGSTQIISTAIIIRNQKKLIKIKIYHFYHWEDNKPY
jgi:hypothetical protein